MISRKLAGSLIAATALLGLGVSTSFVADAADPSFAPTGSAVTKDNCTWTVSGVPSNLSLAPAGEAKYDGSEMTLSSANVDADARPGSIQVFASGAHQTGGSATNHKDCTWFSDTDRESIALTMTASSTSFTAGAESGLDSQMDFAVDDTNPLAAALSGTCKIDGAADSSESPKWSSTGFSLTSLSGASYTSNILSLSESNVTTFPSDGADKGDSCSKSQVWTVKIPAGKNPAYPTETYTFTGPSITYSYTHP